MEVLDGGGELQVCQLAEWIASEGRTEALVAESLEAISRRCALIPFQHVVPVLGDADHVVRGKPHLVSLEGALAAEELIAAIEPAQWVLFAVKSREFKLMEARNGSAVRQLEIRRGGGSGWNGSGRRDW